MRRDLAGRREDEGGGKKGGGQGRDEEEEERKETREKRKGMRGKEEGMNGPLCTLHTTCRTPTNCKIEQQKRTYRYRIPLLPKPRHLPRLPYASLPRQGREQRMDQHEP
ncbi:hypothetical protein B0H13DRAFT_1915286 [Mycena leptocephala]|nr:hypothetical protein B0H13DRAFT_1915286 [Mycena leptocephala]